MRALIFVFTLTIIGGLGKQWKKIDDLKESLTDYNKSADKVFQTTLHTTSKTMFMASQFVDQLSNNYMPIISRLNDTECYQTLFDPESLQSSFQLEVARSQIPLESLLVELRGKLDAINNSVYMVQDIADSKYSICKVLNTNASCEDETNLWLDKIIRTVHCQITPNCNNHIISKRSASNFCSVGSYLCDVIRCISLKSICDGTKDCEDGSDEDNCCYSRGYNNTYRRGNDNCNNHIISKRSAPNFCLVGNYQCGKKCISPKSICDGTYDCDDEIDEENCCYRYGYGGNDFRCRNNGNCISQSSICDGRNDCSDGSDELHCRTRANTTCSIEFGLHQCNSGKCIGVEQVCDGIQNCDDGSDESTLCGSGTCPEDCTNEGGVCFLGPQGPRCLAECPLGTFQTPAGCTAHPKPTNRTVVELLEDIPALASKHESRFIYLKMKYIVAASKMVSDVLKCADPKFPLLSKVLSLQITKKPTVAPIVTETVTTESDDCLFCR